MTHLLLSGRSKGSGRAGEGKDGSKLHGQCRGGSTRICVPKEGNGLPSCSSQCTVAYLAASNLNLSVSLSRVRTRDRRYTLPFNVHLRSSQLYVLWYYVIVLPTRLLLPCVSQQITIYRSSYKLDASYILLKCEGYHGVVNYEYRMEIPRTGMPPWLHCSTTSCCHLEKARRISGSLSDSRTIEMSVALHWGLDTSVSARSESL